jgi:hypothetical protein
MTKLLLLTLLLITQAFAQDLPDLERQESYDLLGGFFALPLKINTSGEFSFTAGARDLVITPPVHMGYSKTVQTYALPQANNIFSISEVSAHTRFLEIKRARYEGGLGIGAMLNATFSLGLVPFKGSSQVMIRRKLTREEKTPGVSLPQELQLMKDWKTGDSGSFQTYGGIELYASVGVSITSLIQSTLTFQNQFKLTITKLNSKTVELKIEEGKLNRKELKLGPWFLNGKYADLQGKSLNAEFKFDLENSAHGVLYKNALQGKISELQKIMALKSQNIVWGGHEKSGYIGIPFVLGRSKSLGHYIYNEEGTETELNLENRQNSGLLSPVSVHQKLLYQNSESIMLYWTSEMAKATGALLTKKFLSIGKAMGIEDFKQLIPKKTKLGSIQTTLGISFNRKEVESLRALDFNLLSQDLQDHCQDLELSCAKEKNLSKIISSLKKLSALRFEDSRKDLGNLLMKEPALIHALIKTLNLKKEVYFKFLSGSFQSLEGVGTVPI